MTTTTISRKEIFSSIIHLITVIALIATTAYLLYYWISSDTRALNNAITQAEKEKRPFESFKILEKAIYSTSDKYTIINLSSFKEAKYQAKELQQQYLKKAIQDNDINAIIYTIDEYSDFSNRTLELMASRKIVDVADKATGYENEGKILLMASEVFRKGHFVTRDNIKSIHYAEKAWKAGSVQSANTMALNYLALKDINNAYLWSLKCVAMCERSDGFDDDVSTELEDIENQLPSATKKTIQRIATNDPMEDF